MAGEVADLIAGLHANIKREKQGRRFAMDALIDAWVENAEMRRKVAEARVGIEELQAGFDLRWKADMRAIKRWQEATGRELVWPDHADLVVWLLEQLEDRDAARNQGQGQADDLQDRGAREADDDMR